MNSESGIVLRDKPRLRLAIPAAVGTTAGWVAIHLLLFPDAMVHLGYTLPLLLGVWHRRPWLLMSQVTATLLFVHFDIFWHTPETVVPLNMRPWAVVLQGANIGLAAVVIYGIMLRRAHLKQHAAELIASRSELDMSHRELERQNQALLRANAEMEAANEELAAREEEISGQNEELQAQAEELEQQAEELQSQSEELHITNEELARRENMLQTLLESARALRGEQQVLSEICRLGLHLVGSEAIAAAVLEKREDNVVLHAHIGFGAEGPSLNRWAFSRSFAILVMRHGRTACLEDASLRKDIELPQPRTGEPMRSVISTPLRLKGVPVGAVEFYSAEPQKWTQEQFRMAEWVATQCSTILEIMRLQSEVQSIAAFPGENPNPVLRIAADGVLLYGNIASANWLTEWGCAVGQRVPDRIFNWMQECLQANALQEHEIEINGRVFVSVFTPISSQGYVNIYGRDITDRKRALEALEKAAEQHRLALEAANLGAWDHRFDTGTIYWDECCRNLFGVSEGDHLEYENVISRIHPDDRHSVDAAVKQAIAGANEGKYHREFRVIWPNGSVHWLASHGRVYFTGEGPSRRAIRFIGANMDMTARRAAEERLRTAMSEAESASRAKDEFLAVLSHELRTPLAPVLLTASLLEARSDLPREIHGDIQTIRQNVELEARIIDDLLDLTRIARGKLQFDFRPCDLHLLIRSAADICCRGEGAPIRLELKSASHIVIGDSARLQQVFWNLLSNARKFTPADGTITVLTYATQDRQIEVKVTDTGAGVEPEFLPRMFRAFEQAESGRSKQFGGLGLGLAICKAITQAHGGTIAAQSEGRGRGTTITFTMPMAGSDTELDRLPAAPAQAALPPMRELRILLVDDHPSTLRVLTKMLSDFGHTVEPAATVQHALELADRQKFDLLVSDIGLPDGTGHELMRCIRKKRDLKGIALSGYGMEEDIVMSREAGFLEHLTKPVDHRRLEHAIHRALATSSK